MLEILKEYFQGREPTDLEINYRGHKVWTQLQQTEFSAKDIHDIQMQYGYDVACWILYKCFKERQSYRDFQAATENRKSPYSADHKDITVVVLVHNPWRSLKENADYQWQLKNVAADAGFNFVYPEIPFRRSIFPNAFYYQELLKRLAGRQVIFITHALASLELRWMLERSQNIPVDILGWLNVSGMLFGTSLPPEGRDWWYSVKHFLNNDYPVLPEVARHNSYCYGDVTFSRPIPMVSMLGFRPTKVFNLGDTARDRELRFWGPHDGYATFTDYLRAPHVVWPLWGEGHYIGVPAHMSRMQSALKWLIDQKSGETAMSY